MTKNNVLFVCTGNICRSPTAEGVFRHYVREKGLAERISYDSAGTHGYHVGDPPDSRSVATALGRGVEMHDLRARRIKADDFDHFTHILAMDRGHFEIMRDMMPASAKSSLAMFMDYAPGLGYTDVPDPYYGGQEGFDLVYDLIEKGVQGLLDELSKDGRQ